MNFASDRIDMQSQLRLEQNHSTDRHGIGNIAEIFYIKIYCLNIAI